MLLQCDSFYTYIPSLSSNFAAVKPIKNKRNESKVINVILEDFYNLLRHRRFGRKSKNEVMIWQPYLFLRFAVSCFHCHSS